MEVGQQFKKVVFIIQARMQSSRLPGKILLPLPLWEEKPMLLWIIEALKASKYYTQIFIATSTNTENDVLEDFCKTHDVNCFRGDEDDVLSRFLHIGRHSDCEIMVRLTADNPFLDVELLDDTIEHHITQENDYTNTETLPLGMNFEVLQKNALLALQSEKLSQADKEHVTLFLKKDARFKKDTYNPKVKTALRTLRLTVDYESDLLVASTILAFSKKSAYKDLKGLKLIERLAQDYPMLFAANGSNIQKKQFSNTSAELNYAKEVLKSIELTRVVSILQKHEEENSI